MSRIGGFTTLKELRVDVLRRNKSDDSTFEFMLVQKKGEQKYAVLGTFKNTDDVCHSQRWDGSWSQGGVVWFNTTGQLLQMVRYQITGAHDQHYMNLLKYIMEEYG